MTITSSTSTTTSGPQSAHGHEQGQEEEVAQAPGGTQRYGGAIPAVAPLRDQASPPSASDRAYGEVARPADDDAQTPTSGASSGPGATRFAHDASLGELEQGHRRFRLGDAGVSVRKIQQALFELGYRPIDITSTYDQVTVDRVADYQAKHNVGNGKGELDSATFKAIEHELDPSSYAHAAKNAPPGIHDTPKGTDAKDVPVMLSETTVLDNDAKAEANAVLNPKHGGTVGKFDDKGYEHELEAELTDTINEHAKRAHAKEHHHDHGEKFSMKDLAKVGNAAKGECDKVFGSWATGAKMVAGTNLVDRYDSDTAKQKKESPDDRLSDARYRARYFMNTESTFTNLDQAHSVDRTRGPEKAIIDRVIDRLARAHEADLLLITATWSASTDSKTGEIHIQRLSDDQGDDGADRDTLWDKFGTLIHEYVHSLAHPKWNAWKATKKGPDSQAAHTLTEGVTELLTHVVISQISTKDPNLRKQVLQGVSDDGSEPDLSRGDAYQDARLRAETLVGVIGINNLYAAYFLGKTELAGG
ncbi:MAG: peptidoglycan-binding domain-containing protein [Kofleriaceae bacterium]